MTITPDLYDFITKVIEDKVKDIKVTREEFDKLSKYVKSLAKNIVELTKIQRRSEERLTRLEAAIERLEKTVAELAEAQKRSEERLTRLEKTVAELAEAQKRSEERLTRLEKTVAELAEAQKRSEERLTRLEKTVAELAEAQKRSEERLTRLEKTVAELAEAQKRSEERLTRLEMVVEQLANSVSNLSREVGSLSATIGFGLEDIARVVVPGWLYRHENIDIDDLSREFFEIDGTMYEINLYGVGKKGEKEIVIIGECKTKIYRSTVRKFVKMLKDLKVLFEGKEILPLMFGFIIYPDAREEAQKYGIRLIASYER
ncbi:MAG: chordopoxvirus fusion protein [Candidatus Asgardarchaeum sp.]